MKTLLRYLTLTAVVGALSISSALAGECCKKAAAAAKEGKTCSHCEKHKCCKDAAAKVEKNKEAKACDKCAKAKEKKS
jgi:hypothetical protein